MLDFEYSLSSPASPDPGETAIMNISAKEINHLLLLEKLFGRTWKLQFPALLLGYHDQQPEQAACLIL